MCGKYKRMNSKFNDKMARVDKDLLKRLKIHCIKNDLTMKEVIKMLIEQYLSQQRENE